MSEMTLPEQVLVRRRLQMLEDKAPEQRALDLLESDHRWVAEFVERLARVVRDIGSRK
jgi:hypothetical protein